MSTRTVRPPASVARCRYIMKHGVECDHFVSRIDHRADRQQERTGAARGDQYLSVGVLKFAVDGRLDLVAQLGNALGDGVGISTRS